MRLFPAASSERFPADVPGLRSVRALYRVYLLPASAAELVEVFTGPDILHDQAAFTVAVDGSPPQLVLNRLPVKPRLPFNRCAPRAFGPGRQVSALPAGDAAIGDLAE